MAPPLLDLPPELFTLIMNLLLPRPETAYEGESGLSWDSMRHIVSLAATCKAMHQTLDPLIYPVVAERFPPVLFWASDRGHTRLVSKLLRAGLNPNRPLVSRDIDGSSLETQLPGSLPVPFFQLFSVSREWGNLRSAQYAILDEQLTENRYSELLDEFDAHTDEWWDYVTPFIVFPLHLAAHAGHGDIVELLLQHGASVCVPSLNLSRCGRPHKALRCACGGKGLTPMHFALASDDIKSVEALMDASPQSIFTGLRRRINAFHSAAGFANEDMIDLLLRKFEKCVADDRAMLDDLFIDSPLLFPDDLGFSPIFYAQAHNRIANIERLVSLGADVDGGIGYGYSPLVSAIMSQQDVVAQKLIALGADVNVVCRDGLVQTCHEKLNGLRPLDICCQRRNPGSAVTVRHLLAAGAQIRRPAPETGHDPAAHDPLIDAAATHQPDILRMLLKAGADPNQLLPNCSFGRPLVATITNVWGVLRHPRWLSSYPASTPREMLKCMELLLDYGADPDGVDADGSNCFSRLHELLELDDLPEDEDDFFVDRTRRWHRGHPFMEQNGSVEVGTLLLQAGSAGNIINQSSTDGTSFLSRAYQLRCSSICRSLIGWGARLREGPEELRLCFDFYIANYGEQVMGPVSANDRQQGPETWCQEAFLSLLGEMDKEGFLESDPYFLASALRHVTTSDKIGKFVLGRYSSPRSIDKAMESIYDGKSLFHHAIESQPISMIKSLLDRLLDPSSMKCFGKPFLTSAMAKLDDLELTTLLLHRGFPVHYQRAGNAEFLENGLESHQSMGHANVADGCTSVCTPWERSLLRNLPVAAAIKNEDSKALDLLLKYDPLCHHIPDDYHFVYLTEACTGPHPELLVLLLGAGANPNATHATTGETPLVFILHKMDIATEKCVTKDWQNSERSDGQRGWIKRWVKCVCVLLEQKGALHDQSEGGTTVLQYVSRILDYKGTTFFRRILRIEALKRWEIVKTTNDNGSVVKTTFKISREDNGRKFIVC